MDFDWHQTPFELDRSLNQREIEESFEDPFAVHLLPDSSRFSVQARFFNLGRSASGQGILSLYRTNGRVIRVIVARTLTAEEEFFYQRKVNQMLAQ